MINQSGNPRTISVSGKADVKVVPDEVDILLQVETWNKSLSISKKDNDKIVNEVINLANNYKIDEKYIQTDYMNINPTYQNKYGKTREISGYTTRKSISVKLTDVNKFENFLSDVVEMGVNHINNIQYKTSKLREYKDRARALAVKAAKEKAIHMAGELGEKISRVHTIIESGGSNPWTYFGGANLSNTVMNTGGDASSSNSFALGQIEISAKVNVVFELE
jgi:hypothetical protein